MNTKQALEKCFEYFLDLEHEAGYRNNHCVYYANGSDPVMCAIGCLLPVKYRERAGKVHGNLGSLFSFAPEIRDFFADTDTTVLGEMQNFHDNWALGGITGREGFLDNLQTLMCYNETVN